MVIGGSLVVACDGQIQWWAGRLVMGSVVRNWWMGSSRPGSGTESLTNSSLARNWLSTQSSRRSGGPIGPRRWSCLGWCRWLLGWFVMGSGGMSVGFWFVGVGFGSWWCNGDVGPWLWLGIDQSKISLCLQTKTKQETHPKPYNFSTMAEINGLGLPIRCWWLWVCFELNFGLWRMWWLCGGGCWLLAAMCEL